MLDSSFVYITMRNIFVLSYNLTCYVTYKFWSTIQNAQVNHYIHKELKNVNPKTCLSPFKWKLYTMTLFISIQLQFSCYYKENLYKKKLTPKITWYVPWSFKYLRLIKDAFFNIEKYDDLFWWHVVGEFLLKTTLYFLL